MTIDHISLCTTPINLFDDNKSKSQGTGFYYVHKDLDKQVLFLITNHHVLTGSAPYKKEPPIGNNIVFQFHKSEIEPNLVKTVKFPLFTKDKKQTWINNPNYPNADLAIIPIPISLFSDCKIKAISAEWSKKIIKIRPTTQVTLIGYPHGYYDKKNCLPIWKTGNVASEPDIDFDEKPMFCVDVSAFPGMSGSPVFAIAYGMYEQEGGGTKVGGARQFIGIYASMTRLKEKKYLEEFDEDSKKGIILKESLQIGHIWKASLILETAKSIDVESYKKEVLNNLI